MEDANLTILDLETEINEEVTKFEIAFNGSKVDGIFVWSKYGGCEIIDINGTDEFMTWYDEDDNYSEFLNFIEEAIDLRKNKK